jgi:hypothetical protein
MKTMKIIYWTLSLFMIMQASMAQSETGLVISTWVLLGTEGEVIARAVTAGSKCPSIVLDAISQPMQVRAEPSTDYPVLVCESVIPLGVASAEIEGRLLPLPKPSPKRIVAFGDAGCRIKPPENVVQDCNDPNAWPAEKVSKTAASEKPDLVVHVGDILYRERQCPPGDSSKCGNSPTGYNWDTFNADFFIPQAELLRASPWILTRGDHETCKRAGSGWFLFFDPRPMPGECLDFTDPYTIQAGDLQIQVFDSSMAQDTSPPPPDSTVVNIYSAQLAALRTVTSNNAWFLTHKPLWGIVEDGNQLVNLSIAMQTASNNNFPNGIKLILTGHIHTFETLRFDVPRPRQVIVGTGGTELDPPITMTVAGTTVAEAKVTGFETVDRFGYLLFERKRNNWKASFRNEAGETLTSFSVPEGGGEGCSVVKSNSPTSILLYLLIPLGILVKRLWKIGRVKS